MSCSGEPAEESADQCECPSTQFETVSPLQDPDKPSLLIPDSVLGERSSRMNSRDLPMTMYDLDYLGSRTLHIMTLRVCATTFGADEVLASIHNLRYFALGHVIRLVPCFCRRKSQTKKR